MVAQILLTWQLTIYFYFAAGYVISYNTQQYFTDLGQTKEQIGDYMSWIPIVGGTFSVTIGGFLSDRIVKKLGLYSRIIVIIVSLVSKKYL
jgi:hypothetical protein